MTTDPKPTVRFRTGLDRPPHPAVVMKYRTMVSDLVVDEKTGLLVPDYDHGLISVQEDYSRSFVKQFLQFILALSANVLLTVKATDDVDWGMASIGTAIRMDGAAGSTAKGIVVGSGTTAVAAADNKLITLIAHGTGAGQLSYAIQVFDANVAVADPNTTYNMTRVMTNGSAASIDVKEIGVYADAGTRSILHIRDLLGATDAVPVGKAYTVIYTPATIA